MFLLSSLLNKLVDYCKIQSGPKVDTHLHMFFRNFETSRLETELIKLLTSLLLRDNLLTAAFHVT